MDGSKTLFVGVDEVQAILGVSQSKGYSIIRMLNQRIKKENPGAIILAGKVNRRYFEEAIMKS